MPGLVSGGVDLDTLRAKIESSIPKEHKRGYDSIMAASLKLMFSDGTFPKMKEYLDKVQSPEQAPEAVAHGVAKAISILMNESKGHMPMEPAVAAAHSIMTHALEYLQTVKKMPVDKEMVAATTKATNQGAMTLLQQYSGLTPEQFEKVLRGKGKELTEADGAQPPAPAEQVAPPAAAAPGMMGV